MDRYSVGIGSRGSEDAHLLYPTETVGITDYTNYFEITWCVACIAMISQQPITAGCLYSAVCSAPHDGAVYIHYGKDACPSGRTKLDGGLIAGAHYTYQLEPPQLNGA